MEGKQSLSVGEVARLSGVTIRTLHHYDEIGLLSPSARSAAGYRLYSDADVDRLQQILFYRELDFPLDEVKAIVDDPAMDVVSHLRRQRELLQSRGERVAAMVQAIDRALEARTMGREMSAEEKLEIFLDLPHVASGKVREMFDAGEHLLMVATDRISVFDVVLPTPIPDKGSVLNGLSVFWFEHTASIVPNHLVEWRASSFGEPTVAGRGMLVRRAQMLPVECIVRGYLSGSGWKDYQRTGSVCGSELPSGLRESDRLPEPLFTPSTKAETGHDENIDIETAGHILGDAALAKRLGEAAIALYEAGAKHAASKGIILADTKFEFGLIDGELVLCDEAMTPDSSRYWPAAEWEPGKTPPSFDKQYVRDYTEGLGWDKTYPGPELPADVVEGTTKRYVEAYEWITGRSFADYIEASK